MSCCCNVGGYPGAFISSPYPSTSLVVTPYAYSPQGYYGNSYYGNSSYYYPNSGSYGTRLYKSGNYGSASGYYGASRKGYYNANVNASYYNPYVNTGYYSGYYGWTTPTVSSGCTNVCNNGYGGCSLKRTYSGYYR